MTQRTKSTIDNDISTQLADNTTQNITAALLRNNITDINDSSQLRDIINSGVMSGVLTLDFNWPVQVIVPTGCCLNSTQNTSQGIIQINTASRDTTGTMSKMCKVIFQPGNHDVSISGWNSSWLWLLPNKPSGIPANYTGLLTLTNFGINENNVMAAWALLGSG